MARFDTAGLEDVLREMEHYGEMVGPVADEMLIAGAEAVKKAWQEEATKRQFSDSGDMIKSIGFPRKAVSAGDIQTIDIYPQGVDKKGVRNAEKAFILHYGTQGSGSKNAQRKRRKRDKVKGPGIPATHWVDDADRASEATVQAAFERIWDNYLKGLKT
jgi:hypothetical protein